MKKPYWTHKKYKTKFKGMYKWLAADGLFQRERVFVLTSGKRTISFESHQSAKKQGWGYHK